MQTERSLVYRLEHNSQLRRRIAVASVPQLSDAEREHI